MSSGERFGPAFEVPADGFCFLRWPPSLRPRMPSIAPGGNSVCVDPFGPFAFTGVGSGVGWYGGEQPSGRVSIEATSL